MMNHQINIGFETEVADENSVRELIRTCAERVLASEQVDFDAEIDVTVVDADAIREMNAEYRNKDAVTDVLSFPMYEFLNGEPQEELEAEPDSGCVMLGDMILCYTRACEQAEQFGHSPARECGPDHAFRAAPARLRPRAQRRGHSPDAQQGRGQPCVPRPDAGLSHEKEYPKTERELSARVPRPAAVHP